MSVRIRSVEERNRGQMSVAHANVVLTSDVRFLTSVCLRLRGGGLLPIRQELFLTFIG